MPERPEFPPPGNWLAAGDATTMASAASAIQATLLRTIMNGFHE